MVLPWIQVMTAFEYLIWKKTFWYVLGRIDVRDVGTWLEKRNLGKGTPHVRRV